MVIAQRPSDFIEMKRCAEALSQRGYDIIIQYFTSLPMKPIDKPVIEDMQRLKQDGTMADCQIYDLTKRENVLLSVGLSFEETITKHNKKFRLSRLLIRLKPILLPVMITTIKAIKAMIFPIVYIKTQQKIKSMVSQLKLDAIILPEDVVGLITPLIIRAGNQLGIPSIIIPYTIANSSEAFQSLRMQSNFHVSGSAPRAFRWPNFIVGKFFPSWLMRHDGLTLLRLPAVHAIGQILTRTAPPDPWMMNSGYADVIAVENKSMWNYYSAAGIPIERMRIVGAIYDDTLAHFLKNKEDEYAQLSNELGIKLQRPILLIGGVADQSTCCPYFEFSDMRTFCNQLGAKVSRLKDEYEIIVRPHPNFPEMGEILAEYGFHNTMIDTARLVALSNAYIAFNSATIRWAISCGVPTINYDVFRYGYDDFKLIKSVACVSSIQAFEVEVDKFRYSGNAYNLKKEQAETDAPNWGTLDGRSVDRIISLIKEVCAARDGGK
jgi:hypothetical protein